MSVVDIEYLRAYLDGEEVNRSLRDKERRLGVLRTIESFLGEHTTEVVNDEMANVFD